MAQERRGRKYTKDLKAHDRLELLTKAELIDAFRNPARSEPLISEEHMQWAIDQALGFEESEIRARWAPDYEPRATQLGR